jgi:multiple sugar transport system permease protein
MTGRQRADRRAGLAFVAPAALALAALALYPSLWVLWLSLQHRVPIFGIARFAGLDHYVFLAGDPRFWNAVRVTLVFTGVSVALELVLGLAVALALQRQRTGRRVAISLLLLAWALPSVVTAKLFEWLYHPSAGLVNVLLGAHALNWLGDPTTALPALILADVWRTMPFVALLCYARLLTIPPEVYEAARVDGASRWRSYRSVTLPLLRPALLVATVLNVIYVFNSFPIVWTLNDRNPGFGHDTTITYMYKIAFKSSLRDVGLSAALGVVNVLAILVAVFLYLRTVRLREQEA